MRSCLVGVCVWVRHDGGHTFCGLLACFRARGELEAVMFLRIMVLVSFCVCVCVLLALRSAELSERVCVCVAVSTPQRKAYGKTIRSANLDRHCFLSRLRSCPAGTFRAIKLETSSLVALMEFLRLLCENHYNEMQDYMRTQPDNMRSYNLVSETRRVFPRLRFLL